MLAAIIGALVGGILGIIGTLAATGRQLKAEARIRADEREHARLLREEEREATRILREGQIGPDAYALRRQIDQWVKDWPLGLNEPGEAQEWARSITVGFDSAEERVTRIVAAAADISSDRAEAARRAYYLFYEATSLLNAAAAGEPRVVVEGNTAWARIGAPESVDEGMEALRLCRAQLTLAIDPQLLATVSMVSKELDQAFRTGEGPL